MISECGLMSPLEYVVFVVGRTDVQGTIMSEDTMHNQVPLVPSSSADVFNIL